VVRSTSQSAAATLSAWKGGARSRATRRCTACWEQLLRVELKMFLVGLRVRLLVGNSFRVSKLYFPIRLRAVRYFKRCYHTNISVSGLLSLHSSQIDIGTASAPSTHQPMAVYLVVQVEGSLEKIDAIVVPPLPSPPPAHPVRVCPHAPRYPVPRQCSITGLQMY
jgi:hypothetical protein